MIQSLSAIRKKIAPIKGILIECMLGLYWLITKYAVFKRHMKRNYAFENIKVYRFCNWHLGFKYFTANWNGNKIFIKLDGIYKSSSIEAAALCKTNLGNEKFFPKLLLYVEEKFGLVVTEFIEGKTLDQFLQQNKLEYRQKKEILTQLSAIIDILHQENIIHRDIRPQNIFIDEVGGQTKLIDFGFSIVEINGSRNDLLINEKARLEGLGGEFKPADFVWDDAFSVAQIAKLMDSDCENKFPEVWKTLQSKIGKKRYSISKENINVCKDDK